MRRGADLAPRDPATATACFVAAVLGWNGPFYPLYVIALTGWSRGRLAFLTMIATPAFLAIARLGGRRPAAGRMALWLVGTVNTLWCMKLLGPGSGVGVFLLPCTLLAVLLPAGAVRLAGAGLPLLALLVPRPWFEPAIMTLTAGQQAHLVVLNQFSAACLTALLALRLGRFVPVSSGA